MSVAGTWNIRIATPFGAQTGKLTVTPDGAGGFAGHVHGGPGSMDIAGKVDGERLTWRMSLSAPLPLDLGCTAQADGDKLTGKLDAGIFGSFALEGTREA